MKPPYNTTLFAVNLQQGFITDTEGMTRIFAAYSHHCKKIVCVDPWIPGDFMIPEFLKHYSIVGALGDGVDIRVWHRGSYKNICDLPIR